MKKKYNTKLFIIVSGIIVLFVFTVVLGINFFPDHQSRSYYGRLNDIISPRINTINIKDNKLEITTSGNVMEYCVKSTKSVPDYNNICWKKIKNNKASINIYAYKKYYIWIKDNRGVISDSTDINPKDYN